MKMNIKRIGIFVFFAAVIVVSIILLVKKDDTQSIETMNTLPSEYLTQTDVITETEKHSYGHDIEQYTDTVAISQSEPTLDETADYPDVSLTAQENDESETSVSSSRTIITSRERKAYDKNSVYIDMENILQNPELPVGCEITALTTLLRFYGFDAEKTDMAKNYLPISWGNPQTIDGKLHKDNFYDYFIGDPFSKGYGCFSNAIEKAAVKYISANGGGYTVKNISGCHPDTLYEYLIADVPVLCWATDGMIEPEFYETWYDNATGEQLDWYLNEHCFVLAGFNIANSTVTLNDPMKGIIDYNIDKFEVRFKQMHSQAIVLIPDNQPDITQTQASETEPPVSEDTSIYSQTQTVIQTEQTQLTEQTTLPTEVSFDTEYIDTGFYTGEFIFE